MQQTAPKVRLFVESALAGAGVLALDAARAHYLGSVMRLGPGDTVAVFNGRDGEWQAGIDSLGRGRCTLRLAERLRPPEPEPDLWLLFAPIKRLKIDLVAAKATELGVSALWPVLTARTVVGRVNVERLRLNAVEAAEQCGRTAVPEVLAPAALDRVLAGWPAERRLLVCDETGAGRPIADALAEARVAAPGPWAVLVGPEGGFTEAERATLARAPFATAVDLGPRTLRAETAAFAALACWQALLGDWRV